MFPFSHTGEQIKCLFHNSSPYLGKRYSFVFQCSPHCTACSLQFYHLLCSHSCKRSDVALNNCRAFVNVSYVIMHLRNLILNYCKFCTVRKSIPNKILDRLVFPKTTQHGQLIMSSTNPSFCKELWFYSSGVQHLQILLYMDFGGALCAPACKNQNTNLD